MGSDAGQIFPTASLHRDHSILYGLVCEKEKSTLRITNWHEVITRERYFYPIPTRLMDSFSCSPLNTSFYIGKHKILPENPEYAEMQHGVVLLTLQ